MAAGRSEPVPNSTAAFRNRWQEHKHNVQPGQSESHENTRLLCLLLDLFQM